MTLSTNEKFKDMLCARKIAGGINFRLDNDVISLEEISKLKLKFILESIIETAYLGKKEIASSAEDLDNITNLYAIIFDMLRIQTPYEYIEPKPRRVLGSTVEVSRFRITLSTISLKPALAVDSNKENTNTESQVDIYCPSLFSRYGRTGDTSKNTKRHERNTC